MAEWRNLLFLDILTAALLTSSPSTQLSNYIRTPIRAKIPP
jgi:hypothetical protein